MLSGIVVFGSIKLYKSDVREPYLEEEAEKAQEIVALIPKNERSSIFSYGIAPAWYIYTDTIPCLKYSFWMDRYIELMPELIADFSSQMEANLPMWFVTQNSGGSIPTFISEILDEHYSLSYITDSFNLYQKVSTY